MLILSCLNLHWLGDNPEEQRQDLCLHGNVFLKIDDEILSDLSDEEWCVSATALRFMRSVEQDHVSGEEQHMIPCCGHFMIATDDLQTVEIYGCCNGIDFDVLHENDSIIIRTSEEKTYIIPFNEYRVAVMSFAQQIKNFYKNSPKRIILDKVLDESGFKAFCNEWICLKETMK